MREIGENVIKMISWPRGGVLYKGDYQSEGGQETSRQGEGPAGTDCPTNAKGGSGDNSVISRCVWGLSIGGWGTGA